VAIYPSTSRSLEFLASAEEVANRVEGRVSDLDPVMVGDTVITRSSRIAEEIMNALKREDIDVTSNIHNGLLLGKVTDRLSNHKYLVHFGSYKSGVYELNASEIVCVRQGLHSLASKRFHNAPPNHLFSGEDLVKLDAELLRNRGMEIVGNWRSLFRQEQQLDPRIKAAYDFIESGTESSIFEACHIANLAKMRGKFVIRESLLYKVVQSGSAMAASRTSLVVPATLRARVIEMCHDRCEHFDATRTLAFLEQYFFWWGSSDQTRRYVHSCLVCQKRRNHCHYVKNFSIPFAERIALAKRGTHWAVDLKTFQEDIYGKRVALVMVDLATRYGIIVPLTSKDAGEVVTAIRNKLLSEVSGSQIELLFDQGSEFVNIAATALFKQYNIVTHMIPVDTPQRNGMVERFNGTLFNHLVKAVADGVVQGNMWSSWAPQFVSIYNSSYNPAIGNTPFFALNAREMHNDLLPFALEPSVSNPAIGLGRSYSDTMEMVQTLKRHDKVFRERIFKSYAAIHSSLELANFFSDHRVFSVGELVLVSLGDSVQSLSHQKAKMHAGPFEIVSRLTGSNFVVRGADGVEIAIHINKLLPYEPCTADLVGAGSLAPSAMGAAEARVFAHEKLWRSAGSAPSSATTSGVVASIGSANRHSLLNTSSANRAVEQWFK
jgi:transposase InsO family protein